MAKSDRDTAGTGAAGGTPRIRWDGSHMKSTYANVCNVASTREEVTLLFGTNQTWNRDQQEVTVELSDRIILNPYAAKRLLLLLQGVIAEYEQRFGTIDIGAGTGGGGRDGTDGGGKD